MDNLKKLTNKEYLRNLNNDNSTADTDNIRHFLIKNVLKTGGHLASNLGVVELTLALHKVFDFPRDKIVFDVGHQSYVHKILSGRYKNFDTLRQFDGMSGFPKTQESEYDSFNTGHSSTSVSAALGMARARDLSGESYEVIALIGDGALGGGMAFEAFNDGGVSNSKIIVVLNDNEMSISKNVGGLSSHLSMLRLNQGYLNVKSKAHYYFDKMGFLGKCLTKFIQKTKKLIKNAAIKVPMFEELGFKYIGMIDGHNLDELTEAFEAAKKSDTSVIIHVSTVKGKGYVYAEDNPSYYHGVSSDKATLTQGTETYTDVFGKYMVCKAEKNNKLVSITAAMCSGCGLSEFSRLYPKKFFDVGIAEQHAVTMAAGMAINGYVPVVSVYSTFLQRAYDQILHDVCIQNLHVVFAIDRAGIVGEDGETHQGIFDLAYLLHLPNMTVLAPGSKQEFTAMLDYAIDNINGPVAIRYPKDYVYDIPDADIQFLNHPTVFHEGDEVILISVGRMLNICKQAAKMLYQENIRSIRVVNLGIVKPLNTDFLDNIISKAKLTVTVEDGIISGGAGQYICSKAKRELRSRIINIGIDDVFVKQGSQPELFDTHGISPDKLVQIIKKELMTNE